MIDLDITFVIQLVNFLIIWMVLNLILFRPIRGIIKKRSEYMAGQLGSIEAFSAQAEGKLANYRKALDDARAAGTEARGRMKLEALAAEQTLLAEAGKDAAATVTAAKSEITAQVDSAMKALKSGVDKMAVRVTAKILGQA